MSSFNDKVNRQLREGMGERAGRRELPDHHRAVNTWLRREAERGTWEAEPGSGGDLFGGPITYDEGQPVKRRGHDR